MTPGDSVLAAFGVRGEPQRLTGGKDVTWRCGEVVLKPSEGEAEIVWRCGVLDALPESVDFRIARPLRTEDGGWLAAGWEAARFVAGRPGPSRVDEVIIAGEARDHRLVGVLATARLGFGGRGRRRALLARGRRERPRSLGAPAGVAAATDPGPDLQNRDRGRGGLARRAGRGLRAGRAPDSGASAGWVAWPG